MGKKAIDKYREDPATFVVGYEEDQEFWDTLLRVGEEYEDEEIVVEDNTPRLSISDRFRSSKRNKSTSNSTNATSNAGTGDSGS
tara:strand:+ start:364 stop:615 length:252 start_codon:yes stop_codon:yes gene_type:complete